MKNIFHIFYRKIIKKSYTLWFKTSRMKMKDLLLLENVCLNETIRNCIHLSLSHVWWRKKKKKIQVSILTFLSTNEDSMCINPSASNIRSSKSLIKIIPWCQAESISQLIKILKFITIMNSSTDKALKNKLINKKINKTIKYVSLKLER